MRIDIDALEVMSHAASQGEWKPLGSQVFTKLGERICMQASVTDAEFIAAANPLVVKQLIARLRAAEESLSSGKCRVIQQW